MKIVIVCSIIQAIGWCFAGLYVYGQHVADMERRERLHAATTEIRKTFKKARDEAQYKKRMQAWADCDNKAWANGKTYDDRLRMLNNCVKKYYKR